MIVTIAERRTEETENDDVDVVLPYDTSVKASLYYSSNDEESLDHFLGEITKTAHEYDDPLFIVGLTVDELHELRRLDADTFIEMWEDQPKMPPVATPAKNKERVAYNAPMLHELVIQYADAFDEDDERVQKSIYLPKHLHLTLSREADERDQTQSQLVERALLQFFNDET